ncbi:CHAT domain-containing protein [Cellulomonas alba]|uniref:CHAT domain-containing protein n=1 Tax=Cellulomonas alba TaxID=3053467 RepID=A0ABT7SDT2_9CELL|nr:CHAT domain-containing protein [Cellulomonas alba]MDM7854347.1 CHAT domain-containing protein [Cellulomonas alba]
MTQTGGPAAGPPALGALIDQVQRAEDDNAEGRSQQARRRLRPVLQVLDQLDESPDVVRLRGRALIELARSEAETRTGPEASLDRLDAMLAAGAADAETGWPGLAPAVAGLRGFLAVRAGRSDEALARLDDAVRLIDDAEPIDACRALLNRGVLHADLRDLPRARSDSLECARRARAAGFARLVFKANHNLGYWNFVAGRLPEALERMEAAAGSLPGPAWPTQILDRARVLLEAGLIGVADQTFAEAAEVFAAQHLPRDVAECELGRAECALLRGEPAAALPLVAAARARFKRRGDDAWVLRAEQLALQAEARALAMAGSAPRDREWAALARRAARVEAGARAGGRESWALAAGYVRLEAQLAQGRLADPAAVLEALGPVRAGDPIGLRLYGRRIRAMLALAAHQRSRAARHVRAGQRDLALHRSRFGSLDLRTAGAVHGVALADLDVDIALATGRSGAVLDAAERARSVIGGTPRVNPPSDPESAQLLTDLRSLVEKHRDTPAATARDRLRAQRDEQRLKHAILARSWHEKGRASGDRTSDVDELRTALARRPQTTLVDVLEHQGRLLAVVVDERGSRLVGLGAVDEVVELVRRTHADLEVTANPLVPAPLRDAALRSLARGLDGLEGRLRDVVAPSGELVVVASGWLAALPWAMLTPRVGRPTVVAPSVQHWLEHAGTASRAPAEVVAAAGPGLKHAEDEVRGVAALWPGARAMVGGDATVERVTQALSSPGVVHLAAHGRHEPDNPLFSSVRLADGPLFAHELDTGGDVPELVLLSSCEIGRASIRAGGEALGFASVLLRTGVGCVVAAAAPLPDETARQVMTRTHALLRAGTPVAEALATATAERAEESGERVPLVTLGAPL